MKTKTKTRKGRKPPTDSVVGYIVRYETQEEAAVRPLLYAGELNDADGFGPVPVALWLDGSGTIFPSFDAATAACLSSIRYQLRNNLSWNEMYGPYVIDAVRAPVIA